MKIIETTKLTKKYRRYKKQEGIIGSIKGLFKREYEEKIAVGSLDLEIEKGEFIGMIGPNGAGKPVILRIDSRRHASLI